MHLVALICCLMLASTKDPWIFLAALCLGVSHALAAPLRACQNYLSSNGTDFELVVVQAYGQYIQCEYFHDNGDGSGGGTYCFYRVSCKVLFPTLPEL